MRKSRWAALAVGVAALIGVGAANAQTAASATEIAPNCQTQLVGYNGAKGKCDSNWHTTTVKCRRSANGAPYSVEGARTPARHWSNTTSCYSGDPRTGAYTSAGGTPAPAP
jgi:hypothetical protein